jgi:hypothetical protein
MYAAYLNIANMLEEQGHPNAPAMRRAAEFVLEAIDMAMSMPLPDMDAIKFLDSLKRPA